jgi:hypothetical protein
MAGRGNPSFLKNQKAKKRQERATEKRAARQARKADKAARANGEAGPDPSELLSTEEPGEVDAETKSESEA